MPDSSPAEKGIFRSTIASSSRDPPPHFALNSPPSAQRKSLGLSRFPPTEPTSPSPMFQPGQNVPLFSFGSVGPSEAGRLSPVPEEDPVDENDRESE